MKTVRLMNNKIIEILPDYALPAEKWYGLEFASQCVEAPDDVRQGLVYDEATKTFAEPVNPMAAKKTAKPTGLKRLFRKG